MEPVMNARARRQGNFLIFLGMLLLFAALGIVVYNFVGDKNAGKASESLLSEVKVLIDKGQEDYDTELEETPDYMRNPDMELPRADIDGHECVGIIQMPTINLELPIIAEFSYEELLSGPCRFFGSPYTNNLVLCAHNFETHFRRIRNLEDGDPVIFVDMDGNIFNYRVALIEVLSPTEVEEMCDSEWDLSLFTCTFDDQSRVTVRCISEDNSSIIQDLE